MLTNVHMVKATIFLVVKHECESWIIEKAEHWRIDAFKLWCWRRLLRIPWTARRSNQSILKEINPEYSLERLMLKLQYFGHLMQITNFLEKTLMLGKIEGGRRRGWKMVGWHHQLNGHEFEQVPGVGDGQGSLACRSPWDRKESDTTEWLNWTFNARGAGSIPGQGAKISHALWPKSQTENRSNIITNSIKALKVVWITKSLKNK